MQTASTSHTIHFSSSELMEELEDETVNTIITSPPYPMITMWDGIFSRWDPAVSDCLGRNDGKGAWEGMHRKLDSVWKECSRVLKPGGFACINIGDATRTVDGCFRLYQNHARIISAFESLGFDSLPLILWRKQTNAPNKFMGSGMLPAGAYITLEHEYILIFRKTRKRNFHEEHDRRLRRESAFFWEERNTWFSDLWEIKGVRQQLTADKKAKERIRSGAFPFEIAYRLVNMYSVKEDLILDPFTGTATTAAAAAVSRRNSIGYEIDASLKPAIKETLLEREETYNSLIGQRITQHADFIHKHRSGGGSVKYENNLLHLPVKTRQETSIQFELIQDLRLIKEDQDKITVEAGYRPADHYVDQQQAE